MQHESTLTIFSEAQRIEALRHFHIIRPSVEVRSLAAEQLVTSKERIRKSHGAVTLLIYSPLPKKKGFHHVLASYTTLAQSQAQPTSHSLPLRAPPPGRP